jgi:RNase H-fold protein (predicted Holliday junction resolvase)
LENKIFQKPTLYNGDTLKETLQDIKEIKDICDKEKINCIFFINPIHQKTYEYTNKKLLKEFKLKLSKITDYYDFSIQNKISKDNSYWIETSHYTIEIGNIIINKIYNKKQNIKFGLHIQKLY